MKALLWNPNGCNRLKLDWLAHIVRAIRADIVILTETHNRPHNFIKTWKSTLLTFGPSNTGVAIWASPNITISNSKINLDGRSISLVASKEGKAFSIFALYAPTNLGKLEWWNPIIPALKHDIILGDFNFVENPTRDRVASTNIGISKPLLSKFQKQIQNYTDPAVELEDLSMTFKNKARIDRFYIKSNLVISDYKIFPNIFNYDHDVLFAEWDYPKPAPPAIWKLEPWVFQDLIARENLECIIANTMVPELEDKFEAWKLFKETLIENLKICQHKEKIRQRKLFLDTSMRSKHSVPRKRKKAIQKQFSRWKQMKTATLARVNMSDITERPSWWINKRVHDKSDSDNPSSIYHPILNKITKDPSEIKDAFKSFYENLFAPSKIEEEVTKELLSHWEKPNFDFSSLANPISKEEISTAIKTMKANKSPGTDGLSALVYKLLQPHQINFLTKVLNKALESGFLPLPWRAGSFLLLGKKV